MRLLAAVAAIVFLWPVAGTATVRAAEPTFGTPTADAPFGGDALFTTTFTADTTPRRVELLLNLPGQPWTTVITAQTTGSNGVAEATYEGHILPNSRLIYRFRLIDTNGDTFLGPQGALLTADDRFDWKTVSGPLVGLHWVGADQAFGERALAVGEEAVQKASQLLGVTEADPIDFYIYNDEQAFRDIFGPGLRENVAGTAISEIRTMFAFLLPSQFDDPFARVLVTHELTHLVFDTATHNIYHSAPHWLNEGLAVYLAEGVTERWQSDVDVAVNIDHNLMPLQGMGGTFGAGDERFELGYAESVSAVDFFVRTYGEEKLWALIRSFAQGVSDDDAFRQAIGVDVAGFNAAWMKSLNYPVPDELGPQPGATGPVPPDWQGLPPATPGPYGQTAPPVTRPTPRTNPGAEPSTPSGSSSVVLLTLGVFVLAIGLVVVLVVVSRRRRGPPPPPPWWQGPPGPGAGLGPPGPPPPPPPTAWDAH